MSTTTSAFHQPFTPELARTIDPSCIIEAHRAAFADAQMAVIAVQPFTLKDIDLKIAADNFELHVHQVLFEPNTQQVSWKGLSPAAVYTDNTSPTWTCKISGVQDLQTANSLAQYLNDPANIGTQKVMIFKPRKGTVGTMATYTVTVTISPVAIGGAVDTVATFEVTLGCAGAPVRTLT